MKKKLSLFLFASLFFATVLNAQKIAVIDLQYMMKNIPSYETANEQLNILSNKWQKEIELALEEVQTMRKNFQTELVFLSDEMKQKREDEILEKEKNVNKLKHDYFGPEGELFKKRSSLMKPLQDEIYTAVQEVCEERFYQMVIDRSSAAGIIFATPKIDISDEVLRKLGYSK